MTDPTNLRPAPAIGDDPPAPEIVPQPGAVASRPAPLPRSRVGELWMVVVAFTVVLLLLLIFILQNGERSDVYFLGAHGHLPMGVALLLSAVFGVLLVTVPAGVRILQLRLMASRNRNRTARRPPATENPAGS